MRTILAALLGLSLSLALPAAGADAPTRRFAVVAGASHGGPGRTPLRYATSDARDVARVLRRLGGVAFDDLVLVEEPDAERLRAALAGVAAEAARARQGGQRVELFVYYSGHSDEQALLLGPSRLDYADLRRELDRVPADVRVAILDSCASGAFTRAKGGVHRPPFLHDASSRVSGHAFLTSSAADEAAQESDRLRASFFTHALLTGLRGAADASADGVVTLNEAYQFAFRETLASTEASQGGAQHATYDIGLIGSGDVVMTDLRRADAVLVVPEPVDGRVFVRNAAGQLVAELRKARGARVELALEEGRYEVRVAREQRVSAATVTLPGGARLVLDEAKLFPVALEASAGRGDAGPLPAPRPPTPGAGELAYVLRARGGGVSVDRRGSPSGFQGEVGASVRFRDVLGVELSAGYLRVDGRTTGRLPNLWTTEPVRDVVSAVPMRVTLQLGLAVRPVRPYLLAGAGLTFVQIDRYAVREYAAQVPHHLWADGKYLSVHAGLGVDVQLSGRLAATLEVRHAFGPQAQLLHDRVDLAMTSATAGLAVTF